MGIRFRNNDVQFGKGCHANLKMYDLDLTGIALILKVETEHVETYDVLIETIKKTADDDVRYKLMHLAEHADGDGTITPIYYYLYMISSK